MAVVPRTAKRAPSPFSPADEMADKLSEIKAEAKRRLIRATNVFMMWSTVAFWSLIIGYATAKGWIL